MIFLNLKLEKTDFFNIAKIRENDKYFSFKLHQEDNLAQKLINQVIINPINKETSVLEIKIKGKNPKKNIDILNKLTEIYIRSGLDEKNIMVINTIDFIDDQLKIIRDSLNIIENQLALFRRQNPNIDIVDKEFGVYFEKQKLDNSLSEQTVNIKYYKSLLNYLENDENPNSIVSPTSMGISNPELNRLINQLLELYSKKDELELTTTNKNPTYLLIISQIKHTKNTIIENVNNLISSSRIYEKDLEKELIHLTIN